MELINKFLNIAAPIFTFFSLCFIFPPFYFFKFVHSIFNSIFTENVAGKVVLITGASSGIGEHMAYEYAKRGAFLALAARRNTPLQEVADRAKQLGSPDAIAILADVSIIDDCRRMVDETISHFGRLDHLVNNAGICSLCPFEEVTDVIDFRPVMDINFWGAVYTTRFAVPYLRNRKGKIVVLSSHAASFPAPRTSFYNASKAALLTFFETLRVELGSDIGITIVTPGFIESEITSGKFYKKGGELEVDQDIRDVQVGTLPVFSVSECAKAIVKSACRGDRYLSEPAWFNVVYIWKVFCPEILEWSFRLFYMPKHGSSQKDTLNKKILDLTGIKNLLYPSTTRSPEIKRD